LHDNNYFLLKNLLERGTRLELYKLGDCEVLKI